MRRTAVVIAMAVCSCAPGSAARSHPDWPHQQTRDIDGGESLAPRAVARTVATVIDDDRPAERAPSEKPAAAPPTGAPAGAADKPAAAATPAPPPPADDDAITTEDIVIEIDD
ncbi:MAG TPA: hypothetical protein VFT22_20700 [Kofleriaceae bacterium]|nr:hypothetical protein [Kofleriaceae bacterium]